jgi:nicotinamidase-related amidase
MNEDYAKQYNVNRKIAPEKSALVIIDMQYATGHPEGPLARKMKQEGNNVTDWRFERIETLVIPNTQKLISEIRKAGGRIIYITIGSALSDYSDAPAHMRDFFRSLGNHVGQDAHRIIAELQPAQGDPIVRKTTVGAFASTGLDHLLRSLGCEQLFMTGVSTNMCVETTAREASDRGYAVTLVEDACATTHKDLHEGTMKNFNRFFGQVKSTVEVLKSL